MITEKHQEQYNTCMFFFWSKLVVNRKSSSVCFSDVSGFNTVKANSDFPEETENKTASGKHLHCRDNPK